MGLRLLPFRPDRAADTEERRFRSDLRTSALVGRLREEIPLRPGLLSVGQIAGQVAEDGFRLRVGGSERGASRNPHRPVLVGRLRELPDGTEVQMHFERPNAWLGNVVSTGALIILPIVFVAGVIGILTGARTDQGESLLPFVLGPLGMAGYCYLFDAVLRGQARRDEGRLLSFVGRLAD
jgi:hypothetical protein